MRRITPYTWAAFAVLLVATAGVLNFPKWRRTAAPHSAAEYFARLSLFAGPALLVPAVVFALGPHTIYAGNTAEFAVSYGELAMPWLLRTVALNWTVLLLVGGMLALISEKAARMYGTLLLATGLLLWGQGNIWNADYGVLAGQDLDLGSHAWRAPYELAGWTAVLVIALVFFRRISRIAALASVAFMGVQTAAVLLAAADAAAPQRARWLEPPANLYQFSATRNVIHVVLDEFQSDVFHDILQQDRSTLNEQFRGFQYFADHAGSFPTTSFSMPAMLTGLEYRNEKSAPDFIRDAFKQSSVFEKVSKAGYDIDAASIVPIDSFEQWLGPDSAPNWKGARFQIRKPYVSRRDYREVTARQLLELSLFRHVPHAGKVFGAEYPASFYRPIWMDRSETPAQVRRHEASNSAAFLQRFIDSMASGRDRPVYKLLHVGVPHRPVVLDRNCRFIGLTDMSRQSYMEQCRCALRLVAALLDRARVLGIYDSSVIIISSDHGTDLEPSGFGGTSESLSPLPGPSTVRLPAIVSTAKAVMLIKPPGRNGPITISEAPTSHVDLPATILDFLGLPAGVQDPLMFRRDPQQRRTRLFGMYNPHVRFPSGFLDRLDVLTLDGRVLDASAWNVRQLIWRPDLRLDSRDVDVGPRTGNYYLGPGWSLGRDETAGNGQHVSFVHALTNRAIISASLPTSAIKLVLRASWPRIEGPRSIRVDMDGRPAGLLTPSGHDGYHDFVISISPDPSRPPISEIILHFDRGSKRNFVFKLDRLIIGSGR
jgi:hypothetical protein